MVKPAEVPAWVLEIRYGDSVVFTAEVPAGWAGQIISRTEKELESAKLLEVVSMILKEKPKKK